MRTRPAASWPYSWALVSVYKDRNEPLRDGDGLLWDSSRSVLETFGGRHSRDGGAGTAAQADVLGHPAPGSSPGRTVAARRSELPRPLSVPRLRRRPVAPRPSSAGPSEPRHQLGAPRRLRDTRKKMNHVMVYVRRPFPETPSCRSLRQDEWE